MQEPKDLTIRDQIDNLHALLTEALTGTARIVGEELPPPKDAKAKEPIMDAICFDLDRALNKAHRLVTMVCRIEERL